MCLHPRVEQLPRTAQELHLAARRQSLWCRAGGSHSNSQWQTQSGMPLGAMQADELEEHYGFYARMHELVSASAQASTCSMVWQQAKAVQNFWICLTPLYTLLMGSSALIPLNTCENVAFTSNW